MSHFNEAESIATNTLLIPDIPLIFFGCDDAMLTIHDAFASFGPLYAFVRMKSFHRLMIIFQETTHAMKAKKELDHSFIIYTTRELYPDIITLTKLDDKGKKAWIDLGNQLLKLRVYYGQHCATHVDPNQTSLQVPQFQRNLLISPPGAPFEGWEQIEEDAPNQKILASDLIHAAEISDCELDEDEFSLEVEMEKPIKKEPSKFSIICSKGTGQQEHLPSITVQNWDDSNNVKVELLDEDMKLSKKKATLADLAPTALPPVARQQSF